jgi:hypothetical protein
MSNAGAMKQLRGPRGPCATRALPRLGKYMALKVVKNGHLARTNGAIDGPYCSPTCGPVCLEGGVSRWVIGWWVWGRSCTIAHMRRVGRFFNSSALGKRAVSRPSGWLGSKWIN